MKLKLNTSTWKEFRFGDLIDSIYKSISHDFEELEFAGSWSKNTVSYVTRTEFDNSVKALVSKEGIAEIENGNALVIGDTTSTISYQEGPFVSGEHIIVIRARWLNISTGLFITSLLRRERYKYSYGRAYKMQLINDTIIKLPVTANGCPDWQWMEDYIASLHSKPLETMNSPKHETFDVNTWKWFKLGGEEGLFDIRKGKRLTSEDQTEGDIPYIGAIDSNNGVSNYIGQEPIHEGNTISLSYNGSVGEAFYQPVPYWATDDVNALYLRAEYGTLNPSIGLFICTLLKHEKYRYSYGRKWTLENMEETEIKLPATADGAPDWQWMESYIKALPYGDKLK